MFDKFPYTNFHDLNANWIVKKIKDVETAVADLTVNLPARVLAAIQALLPWTVAHGGTGANNAADARTNLDVYSKQETLTSTEITALLPSSTNILPVSSGGTGSGTASGARTNLDVYSKAEVDSTVWNVANGGTGATNISDARTNMSVYSKAEVDAKTWGIAHGGTGATDRNNAKYNLGIFLTDTAPANPVYGDIWLKPRS